MLFHFVCRLFTDVVLVLADDVVVIEVFVVCSSHVSHLRHCTLIWQAITINVVHHRPPNKGYNRYIDTPS